MLLSNDGRIVFIHIPKCAGTSIRRELAPSAAFPWARVADDLAAGHYVSANPEAPLIGHHDAIRLNLAHIPLGHMRAHFPQMFELVRTTPAFTVLRDPRDRFVSAIMQRLREFRKKGATRLEPNDIRAEARRVTDWLADHPDSMALDHIHFTRQADYIRLDGLVHVDTVFRIGRLDRMRHWLRECGQDLGPPKQLNRSARPSGIVGALHRHLGPAWRRVVPRAVRDPVFRYLRNTSAFAPASSGYGELRLDPSTETFISDWYREDFDLFESDGVEAEAWRPDVPAPAQPSRSRHAQT